MSNITKVIYHGPYCPDGVTSALIAWSVLKDTVEYLPYSHGMEPPSFYNENVLILDFAFNKEILLKIIDEAENVLIIDHHTTNQQELQNIPDKYKIFDMNECGASLTWKYFYPNIPLPKFVQYIRDRDLWKKEMYNTDEFNSGFMLHINNNLNLSEHEKLSKLYILFSNNNIDKIIQDGKNIIQYEKNYREMIIKRSSTELIKIEDKYYIVAYCESTPILKSEIGNDLINYYPICDFAIVPTYNIHRNETHFSLRSENSRIDVSQIAKIFGGGGHRNASGMKISGMHFLIGKSLKINCKTFINVLSTINIQIINNLRIARINSSMYHSHLAKYLLSKNNNIDVVAIDSYDYLLNETKLIIIFRNKKILKYNMKGKAFDLSLILKSN